MGRVSLYLTKVEKQVLYKKYIALGNSSGDANIKIKNFVNHLSEMVEKLKAQNKPEGEINKRFKREFEKLCQKLEVER